MAKLLLAFVDGPVDDEVGEIGVHGERVDDHEAFLGVGVVCVNGFGVGSGAAFSTKGGLVIPGGSVHAAVGDLIKSAGERSADGIRLLREDGESGRGIATVKIGVSGGD